MPKAVNWGFTETSEDERCLKSMTISVVGGVHVYTTFRSLNAVAQSVECRDPSIRWQAPYY